MITHTGDRSCYTCNTPGKIAYRPYMGRYTYCNQVNQVRQGLLVIPGSILGCCIANTASTGCTASTGGIKYSHMLPMYAEYEACLQGESVHRLVKFHRDFLQQTRKTGALRAGSVE